MVSLASGDHSCGLYLLSCVLEAGAAEGSQVRSSAHFCSLLRQGYNSKVPWTGPRENNEDEVLGDILGCWEDIFSVLLAASMEHACMVQPGLLLFVCPFVISLPKEDAVSYRSTEHREKR